MKKKLVFGLSAAAISGAFWACGSGEVIEYDPNLEELALAMVEGLGDAEIAKAIKSCEADTFGCAIEMRNAGPLPTSSDGSTQSSSRVQQSSSSNQLPKSSMVPQSSMTFVPQSSSAPVFASSNSNPPVEESSSSVAPGPGSDYGTCSPVKTPINRGEKTAWKMTKNATLNAQVVLNADFDWTFADGTPATSAKHGNMSSDEITYATSGLKSATLVFTPQGSGPVSIECSALQVNGAAITGCKCVGKNLSPDVAASESATWEASGCVTSGANITGYTWKGATADATGLIATAPVAAKGDIVTGVSFTVANDDNTEIVVPCEDAVAIDASKPDYLLEDQNTAIELPAGTSTLVLNLPESWHNGLTGNCTFACNFQNPASTASIGGTALQGSNYKTASIPISKTVKNTALEVILGEAASCQVGW